MLPKARNAIISPFEFQRDNDQIVLIIKNWGFQCVNPWSTLVAHARYPKAHTHSHTQINKHKTPPDHVFPLKACYNALVQQSSNYAQWNHVGELFRNAPYPGCTPSQLHQIFWGCNSDISFFHVPRVFEAMSQKHRSGDI